MKKSRKQKKRNIIQLVATTCYNLSFLYRYETFLHKENANKMYCSRYTERGRKIKRERENEREREREIE